MEFLKHETIIRRLLYSIIIILSIILFISIVGTVISSDTGQYESQAEVPMEDREKLGGDRPNSTVVTSNTGGETYIAKIAENGTLTYYNDTYDSYWDVDRSVTGEQTVIYSAAQKTPDADGCDPTTCSLQVVERLNFTTGETTRLYSRTLPEYHNSEWHDVDEINESQIIIADMHQDAVFEVDISAKVVTWGWFAQDEFPLTGGGDYPRDWVHLNDVEILDDGRILVSLRNQDQVVFINRSEGIQSDWTLGVEDNHDILYEQHNPDYIPESEGGPALLVADSENNRIVEYQREDGDWKQSWVWSHRGTQWARDADRLPNGNTLISDTHGGKIIEVNQTGEIVWEIPADGPYEAERLGTGSESENGQSAEQLGLKDNTATGNEVTDSRWSPVDVLYTLRQELVPNKVANGLRSVLPTWINLVDIALALLLSGSLFLLAVLEFYWSEYRVRSPIGKS